MRVLILDTLYSDFIDTVQLDESSTYEKELRKVLDVAFGTGDFYGRALSALGWNSVDLVVNHDRLQKMWARERGVTGDVLNAQIAAFKPSIIFLQDLSIQIPKGDYLVAGQCSCRFPEQKDLRKCDVIFSSIPAHVKQFNSMGIRSVFCPLAFEPSVLIEQPMRDLDAVFVGGLGRNSYWKAGVELFERIAEEISDRFIWYGYTTGTISDKLQSRWRGFAWGQQMYRLYQRARIVVNRHGEISQGATNNLRTFEATGTGALLLTEASSNLSDFFAPDECVTYSSHADAVEKIRYYLEHDDERAAIAARGQARTLRDHTYAQRMKTVSNALSEMLVCK